MSNVLIGKGERPQSLLLNRANRHGLISGATGTGKTVTLQILAEGFAEQGVPVFAADVKGDLSGIAVPGKGGAKLTARAEKVGMTDYEPRGFTTIFWDLYGKQGHPIRTTVSEMGPMMLSRLLELNDTQEGVLNIAFVVADENGWLILDIADLRSVLVFVSEHRKEISTRYGNVSPASVGAIQRRLLVLEQQGAKKFFGEPSFELQDLLQLDESGRGNINILAANKLIESPRLYSTFLLWLLSELFEQLPEVGDPEKPSLVFFFDEAHLLFDDAPKALIQVIERVVRLIRSKGVGVYFVTQSPMDIPDTVLGQLGNRVQHALRAYTPRDRKVVKAAAQTFRQNPAIDCEQVITELEVGEALVSTLEPKGAPGVVERTLVRPPESRMGPAKRAERAVLMAASPFLDKYTETIDRESAHEVLRKRAEEQALLEESAKRSQTMDRHRAVKKKSGRRRQGPVEALATSAARSVGTQLGRQIVRGVLGSLLRSR